MADPNPDKYVSAQRPALSGTTTQGRMISTRALAISAVAVSVLAAIVTVVTTRERTPAPALPHAEDAPPAPDTTVSPITAEAPAPSGQVEPAPAADPTPPPPQPKATARPSRPVVRPISAEPVVDRPPQALPPPPVWNGRIVDGRIDHPEPMPPEWQPRDPGLPPQPLWNGQVVNGRVTGHVQLPPGAAPDYPDSPAPPVWNGRVVDGRVRR